MVGWLFSCLSVGEEDTYIIYHLYKHSIVQDRTELFIPSSVYSMIEYIVCGIYIYHNYHHPHDTVADYVLLHHLHRTGMC